MRIALLIEHPTWSNHLIKRALDRGIDLVPVCVAEPVAIEAALATGADLWVNRINAMPSAGRPASVVAAAAHLLLRLELSGAQVVNGVRCHAIGASKAAQAELFAACGVATPATVAIHTSSDAGKAAALVGFPLLTKPNVGGSGSGIAYYGSPSELTDAVAHNTIDLGIDGTAVVQQAISSADGMVYRVEMLGPNLFYGTRQLQQSGSFNYCAADGCSLDDNNGNTIELYEPPADVVGAVADMLRLSDSLVGGAEYLIDAATGAPTFYDFNPYSNFVTGLDDQLGFNPIDRYLDFVLGL